MRSLVHQVALVSEVDGVSMEMLALVSAALQRQIAQDFQPIWNIAATVSPYRQLESVPLGAWPIIVTDQDLDGAAGVHNEKSNGQPFALVEVGTSWSLTASHECLEMLVDPEGRKVMTGPSPKPEQGIVEFLVEVCDPCEDARYAYSSRGAVVSDFYTPMYFDTDTSPNGRYSFRGSIEAPRQVLQGGYLSWHDPESDHWFQAKWFEGESVEFVDLGRLTDDGSSFRTQIDTRTQEREQLSHVPVQAPSMLVAKESCDADTRAATARAKALRAQIADIKAGQQKGGGASDAKQGKKRAA